MKGIVWYKDYQKGKDKFDQIIKDYVWLNIKIKKQLISKVSNSWVLFENGDLWHLLPSIECFRGFRTNISYVDSDIDEEYVYNIIYRSTTAKPYQAIVYY